MISQRTPSTHIFFDLNSMKSAPTSKACKVKIAMDPNIKPTANDIIYGRGMLYQNHRGNQRFRAVIAVHMPKYADPNTTRSNKTHIVQNIVEDMYNEGCRFLKLDKNTKLWSDVGNHNAKKKVGHALRDAISEMSRYLSGPKVRPSIIRASSSSRDSQSTAVLQPPWNDMYPIKSSSSPSSYGEDLNTRSGSDNGGGSDNDQLFPLSTGFCKKYASTESTVGLPKLLPMSRHQVTTQPTNERPDNTVVSCAFETEDDEDFFSSVVDLLDQAS